MIEKALKYIMSFRDIEIVEHDGVKYSNQPLNKFKPLQADHVTTKSLVSIIDLVASELTHARISGRKIIIQVVGPKEVNVFTSMDVNLDRLLLFKAEAEVPSLQLNSFISLEAMNIHLKSCFVPQEERENLITLLGNITEEAVKTSTDDGFSQTVVARQGVAMKANVTAPSIVKLTPFRTFIEVEQPAGEFLVRLQDGPKVALFEADGGAWKLQARKNIKQYLFDALELRFNEAEMERILVLE